MKQLLFLALLILCSCRPAASGFLIAHTAEPCLEAGVPVCYLNERNDTIIPFGKYRFCQIDTIKQIGFAYDNRGNIVCLNKEGKRLFHVFQYDNGPDDLKEGLFRIVNEKGEIGYADSLGNVVIKPQFAYAFPFESGKGKVTYHGKLIHTDDAEHACWDSDKWFFIDKKGAIYHTVSRPY